MRSSHTMQSLSKHRYATVPPRRLPREGGDPVCRLQVEGKGLGDLLPVYWTPGLAKSGYPNLTFEVDRAEVS